MAVTLGPSLFSGLGAATSDIFAGLGAETKAQGDILEAQAYDQAAQLAQQNEQYTQLSTAISEAQSQRELYTSLGRTQSELAGATCGNDSKRAAKISADT